MSQLIINERIIEKYGDIEAGSWSEDMENLRLNYYEEYIKQQAKK